MLNSFDDDNPYLVLTDEVVVARFVWLCLRVILVSRMAADQDTDQLRFSVEVRGFCETVFRYVRV